MIKDTYDQIEWYINRNLNKILLGQPNSISPDTQQNNYGDMHKKWKLMIKWDGETQQYVTNNSEKYLWTLRPR